jgi:hypothetical protein
MPAPTIQHAKGEPNHFRIPGSSGRPRSNPDLGQKPDPCVRKITLTRMGPKELSNGSLVERDCWNSANPFLKTSLWPLEH